MPTMVLRNRFAVVRSDSFEAGVGEAGLPESEPTQTGLPSVFSITSRTFGESSSLRE